MTGQRFLKMLAIVAVSALLIDLFIGRAGYKLLSTAKGGDAARAYHINKKTEAEVLIFGSSRALHHYDPKVLEREWGKTVYNAGNDGCGILLSYMQLTNILERYTPETIILDLYGPYDFLRETDYSQYLGWARPFYGHGNTALDSVINDADPSERIKNLSGAYRYNYRFAQVLFDNIVSRTTDYHGYRPENATLNPSMATDLTWHEKALDPLKLEYLRRFAQRCRQRGVKLCVIVSPYFYHEPANRQIPQEVRRIFEAYGVQPIDMSREPDIIGNPSLFYDTNHLNEAGAKAFTQKVAERIGSAKN